MPRTLNANAISNINGSTVYPIFLVALNFDAPVYAHSDYGTISHTPPYLSSPVNYLGVGNLGSVSAINEDPKIAAKFVTLTLSGIPNNLISTAINTNYQGKDCSIEIGLLNPDTHQILDAPIVFSGYIDTMDLQIAQTATIKLSVIDKLVRFDKASNRRFNHEDQQKYHPSDNAFIYQNELKEQELIWGGIR